MSMTTQGDGLLAFIERAAKDPTFDVSKLEALLRLRREERQEMAKQEYYAAMSRCQAIMEPVIRGKPNPGTQSRYANLEAIDGQMRPIYTAEGFSVTYGSDQAPQPGWIRVTCTVAHVAGHSETHYLDGPTAAVSRAMTQIQGIGSAVTYLRRYLLSLVFNIVQGDIAGEDRDGEEGRREDMRAAAASIQRAPRVVAPDRVAEYEAPQAPETPLPDYSDAQWDAWLFKLRAACAVLSRRSELVDMTGANKMVGKVLAEGPAWVRTDIDDILAKNFKRLPEEPPTGDDLPEVEIAGADKLAAG